MRHIYLSASHATALLNSLELFQTFCFEIISNQNLKLFLQFILRVGNLITALPLPLPLPLPSSSLSSHPAGSDSHGMSCHRLVAGSESGTESGLPNIGESGPRPLRGYRLESLLQLRSIKSNQLSLLLDSESKPGSMLSESLTVAEPSSTSHSSSSTRSHLSESGWGGSGGTVSLLFYSIYSLRRRDLRWFDFSEELVSSSTSTQQRLTIESLIVDFEEMRREHREKRKMLQDIIELQERRGEREREGESEGERQREEERDEERRRASEGEGEGEGDGKGERTRDTWEQAKDEMRKGREQIEKYFVEVLLLPIS
jgi:hypothetical protein